MGFSRDAKQIKENSNVISYKAKEREPSAWGYNWATLSLGEMNTGTWPSKLGVGLETDELAL
jgi:hypothetical protein